MTNLYIGFGLILGAILSPLFLGYANNLSITWVSLISSLGTMLATVSLVIYTKFLTEEARLTRENQIAPHLLVSLEPGRHINFFDFIVENSGNGPAFEVKVDLFPKNVSNSQEARASRIYKEGHFSVSVVRPRQVIRMYYAPWHDIDPKTRTCKLHYKDQLGKSTTLSFEIDLNAYEGFGGLGQDPIEKMAQATERMSQAIERITNGHATMKIESLDQSDVKEREAGMTRLINDQLGKENDSFSDWT